MVKSQEPGHLEGGIVPAAPQEVTKHEPVPASKQVAGDDFHDSLQAYPQKLPDGWLMHLIGCLRGAIKIDVKRDSHFAWHVAGYWLSHVDPHDSRKFNTWGHGDHNAQQHAAASLENHPDDPPCIVECCHQLITMCQHKKAG